MIQYENQLSKTYRKCFLMASKLSNAPAEVPLPNCDPSHSAESVTGSGHVQPMVRHSTLPLSEFTLGIYYPGHGKRIAQKIYYTIDQRRISFFLQVCHPRIRRDCGAGWIICSSIPAKWK